MGADDANEGDRPGECPGHQWGLIEAVAGSDGAHLEKVCTVCGAVVMVGPRELGGWV